MLGASPERSPLRIFGDWITLVPARVGHCHALDSAVVSLIDGLIAFLLPDEKWAHVAEDSIALALRDLRLSLQSPDMQYEDVDLALAGIILLFVEVRGMLFDQISLLIDDRFSWVSEISDTSRILMASPEY